MIEFRKSVQIGIRVSFSGKNKARGDKYEKR